MDDPKKKKKKIPHQKPTLITDLPENLLYHIISYLPLEDIARMSVSLSSWRNLCSTTPYLTLNLDDQFSVKNNNSNSSAAIRLMHYLNFVERMLFLRGLLQLDRFKLDFTRAVEYCNYRVETWIHHAIVNCNVQELHLTLGPVQPKPNVHPVVLPRQLFDHISLKVLYLNMNNQNLKIPESVRFNSLQSLSLACVKLVDDPFGSWMATRCPAIKTVKLVNCFGFTTLNVSSSTLETFIMLDPTWSSMHHLNISCPELTTLQLFLGSPFAAGNSFSLLAPQLQSFIWSGRAVCNCRSGSLTSLQTANVNIACYPRTEHDWKVVYHFGKELFYLLIHVNSLQLCVLSVQVLAFLMKFEGLLPLSKIDHLKVRTHLQNHETRSIMFLLQRLPTLKTLVICENISRHSPILPLTVQQSLEIDKYLNMEVVHGLSKAEIRLLGSGTNNIELVKFLCKNAKALKKLILLYSGSDFALAKKVFREVNSMKMPASFTKLYFVPD